MLREQHPQRSLARRMRLQEPGGEFLHRLKARAHTLGQRADQRFHQFSSVTGHRPLQPRSIQIRQRHQGHLKGHAVIRHAWRVQVSNGQAAGPHIQRTRERRVVGFLGDQVRTLQQQRARITPLRLAPPSLKVRSTVHRCGHTLVIEAIHRLGIGQQVAAPSRLRPGLRVLQRGAIGVKERRVHAQLLLHQRAADEHHASVGGVHRSVWHATLLDQVELAQAHALPRRNLTGFANPVRLAERALHDVRRGTFHPVGLNARHHARLPAPRVHDLERHHPRWLRARQPTARMQHEGAAVAQAVLTVTTAQGHLRGESGQHRSMHRRRTPQAVVGSRVQLQALAQQALELASHVGPLAQTAMRQVPLATPALQRRRAQRVLRLAPCRPQSKRADQVAVTVAEWRVRQVRLLRTVGGSLPRIHA